jgi:hypothetical protein
VCVCVCVCENDNSDFFASSGADCRVMVFRTNFDQMPTAAASIKPKARDNPTPAATGPTATATIRARPTTAIAAGVAGGESKRAPTNIEQSSSSPLRPSTAPAHRHPHAHATATGVTGVATTAATAVSSLPMDPPYHPEVDYPYDCNYQHSHHHPTIGGVTHAYTPPHSLPQSHTHAHANGYVHHGHTHGHVAPLARVDQASVAGSTRVQNKQHVSATNRQSMAAPTITSHNGVGTGPTLGGIGDGHGEVFEAVPVSDHIRRLPEELSTTLAHIVGQLDVMAKTMAALEMRMRLQETNVARIQQQLIGNLSPLIFIPHRTNSCDD